MSTADPTPAPAAASVWRRELVRKSIHLGLVVLPLWIAWGPPSWRSRGLFLAFLLVLSADAFRRVWKPWARWIATHAGAYSRPWEHQWWIGVHALFGSAWILSRVVTPEIAVVALGYALFGDTAAALVGTRNAATGKSWRGSLACFATCLVVGLVAWSGPWTGILGGAAAATLLERFSGRINDNLTVPLGSAWVLTWLR